MGADKRTGLRDRPVRAQVRPGEIRARPFTRLSAFLPTCPPACPPVCPPACPTCPPVCPTCPPDLPETMDTILVQIDTKLMDGITQWQHPRFFACFPTNAAPPSMLAGFVTAIIAPQCML